MMKKGIIIATALTASLVLAACSQKVPEAGSAYMMKSKCSCKVMRGKSSCKAKMSKAHKCKVNACKVKHCKSNRLHRY